MSKLKSQHSKIDKNISFTYVIPDTLVFDDTFFNKCSLQLLKSPLRYQLPPIDINFSILTSIENLPNLYDNAMK